MTIADLRRGAWFAPLGACALMLLLSAGGDSARALLRWDRAGLTAGQSWRWLTGHFVHLGWEHALLDLGGLCLLWGLFGRERSPRQWGLVVLGSIAAIDAGLWFLDPTLQWYVGSSGWLHGVFAAGIVSWVAARRPERHTPDRQTPDRHTEGWLLAVVLPGKLLWEHFQGALPLTSGGAVVTQAHLYGAAGGLLAAIMLEWRRKPL